MALYPLAMTVNTRWFDKEAALVYVTRFVVPPVARIAHTVDALFVGKINEGLTPL